jgi:SAM-dependent methyltransferase
MAVTEKYVHGYTEREAERLHDQAATLADLLHHDTRYAEGSTVLEAGCGVGAQTVILATNSPGTRITSVDISPESIAQADRLLGTRGITNVSLRVADIFDLPFEDGEFDHVFVCFLLEHLTDPEGALERLKRVLRPGGSVTVIEGDHGSAFFNPPSESADRAIGCLVESQARLGGDSLIGRRLYPLLVEAGLKDVLVSPRMVYADASRPEMVEGFTRNTFTAMVEGARERALELGLASAAEFDRGVADLYRTAEEDGVFCYTFFKAIGQASA